MDLTPAQVARTDQELAGFENAVHVLCDHWQTAIPDEPRAVRIGCLVHELAAMPAEHLAGLVAVAVERLTGGAR
jgi:hypothetical protein